MSQIKRLYLEGAGPRLCCVDFGGDAGHDLHLEQPEAWRAVVTRFLQELTDTVQTS